MRVLIDADAFICLRKWDLLALLVRSSHVELHQGGFAAYHELNRIHSEIEELESSGSLEIHSIKARTSAYSVYREIVKGGADRGEAEAVAWAVDSKKTRDMVFVSLDVRARRLASSRGMVTCDVFDLMVSLSVQGHCSTDEVRKRLVDWDDIRKGFCRPGHYTTFDETWGRRLEQLK